MTEIVVEGPEMVLVEKMKRVRGKDEEVVKVVEKMKKAEVRVLRGDKWEIEGDLVLKKEKVYMPKDEKLRLEVILHHNVSVAGYRER